MPEVLAIDHSSFELPWSEEDVFRLLRQRNCICMVAEQGERIVGFMIYGLYKNKLHVLRFATHPQLRRTGVGKAMINALIDKLSPTRRTSFSLDVRETNLGAQKFYQTMGLRAVGVSREHYEDTGEDAYMMEYRLDTHTVPEVETQPVTPTFRSKNLVQDPTIKKKTVAGEYVHNGEKAVDATIRRYRAGDETAIYAIQDKFAGYISTHYALDRKDQILVATNSQDIPIGFLAYTTSIDGNKAYRATLKDWAVSPEFDTGAVKEELIDKLKKEMLRMTNKAIVSAKIDASNIEDLDFFKNHLKVVPKPNGMQFDVELELSKSTL